MLYNKIAEQKEYKGVFEDGTYITETVERHRI